MGISVYYNLNHQCFKCSYSPPICKYKIDSIDKFSRLYLLYIDTSSSQLKKLKIKKYRRSFKVFLGDILINIGNKLSHHTHYSTSKKNNNWYMWRR